MWETKNVTSRNYLPANVTNIVMQMRQEEESQVIWEVVSEWLSKRNWRRRSRSQTVTFPWWVPKTERITSEISPSVA